MGSEGQGKRTQADYHERGNPRLYLVTLGHVSQSNESGEWAQKKEKHRSKCCFFCCPASKDGYHCHVI